MLAALRTAHPYEEPAFQVLELASWSSPRGLGRVGTLTEPMALQTFAEHVARVLPRTNGGVRIAGRSTPPSSASRCAAGRGTR